MAHTDRTAASLERARQGDRDAFDSLVETFRAELEAHVRRRIGASLRSRVECEDALQETYTRAWNAVARFRGSDERVLFAWLKTIAEHAIVDLVNRQRKDRDVIYLPAAHEPAQDTEPTPSRALRREERFERLRRALDSLSPEHREAVLLVRIQGLRIREAAQRMSRTPNAVTKLLTRALEKLKDAFGDTDSLHLPPSRLSDKSEDSR